MSMSNGRLSHTLTVTVVTRYCDLDLTIVMNNMKCFVPKCTNSKRDQPHKSFFYVRDCVKKRWCQQAHVAYDSKYQYYCCEDHLNLEEDLENYYYWKYMKGRPIIKPTADLKLNSNDPLQALENTEEVSELQKLLIDKENVLPYEVQVNSYPAASKALFSNDVGVQCKVSTAHKSTNYVARKPHLKLQPTEATLVSPSTSSATPTASENQSVSGWSSESEFSENFTVKDVQLRQLFLDLIKKNPKRYLGIPQQFWWALQHICDEDSDKISQLSLIVTLFKIKQNDSMIRISDQFQINPSALTNMFERGVEYLANFFQNLIYLPSPKEIKANLPTVFKIRYSNVQVILDCFEIEIEKPSNPLRQAQTWSQYKSCNTLKYLIGCTPNGFVAFISGGLGGRISDKAILERSNLIDILPFNAVVMADRGFKEVETHLMTKGVKLLRPPSVYSGTKPTKEQVVLTKVIASLRVHVERVIRRLREFRMLKLHSVVNHTHVGYMDQIVAIACGLINLQDTIIKNI